MKKIKLPKGRKDTIKYIQLLIDLIATANKEFYILFEECENYLKNENEDKKQDNIDKKLHKIISSRREKYSLLISFFEESLETVKEMGFDIYSALGTEGENE